jgi:hypothetical protein
MTRSSSRYVLLCLSIAVFAAAGCGSSTSSPSKPASGPTSGLSPSTSGSTSVPVPRSGFAAQVNTLCKQGNAAVAAATSFNAKVSVIESYVAKFQALTPPAGLKTTYASFIADLKAEVAAANAKDRAALRKANADVKLHGAKLGAPNCAGHA